MRNGTRKIYTLAATVPAQTTGFVVSKDMDGSVVFNALEVRGAFTTLTLDGADIVDYGVSSLSFKIVEGGTDYQFNDNYTPVEMLLSPGRKKSPLATNASTAEPVNAVYSPLSFEHQFTKKIELLFSNNSDVDQEINLSFLGYELKKYQ